jgi:hypothetical protein
MTVQLTIIDGTDESLYTILPDEEKKGQRVLIQTAPWEPGDPMMPWRVALHPWIQGLGPSRISAAVTMGGDLRNRPSMVYAKANGDASNENFFTFPPLVTIINQPISTIVSYPASASRMPYDTATYGTGTYFGGAGFSGIAGDIAVAVRNFAGNAYFAGGQYLLRLDPNLVLTLIYNFGTGAVVHDLEVFNDELIIALGPTRKIWKMTTGEVFTEATDLTHAIALGRNEDKLWRAETPNKLSNCIDAPLELDNWVPVDPEQYTAGDTTWDVNDLIEYSGALAALKPDGAYFPNTQTAYLNQTPQLAVYPDVDNGKGNFSAFGNLYVPSVAGLLEVSVGNSPAVGPELSHRPDYRTRVRSGVEWQRDIYAGTNDEAEVEETYICKMDRQFGDPFAYHEWCRLGSTAPVKVMIVYTGAPNPTLCAGVGDQLALITLGRGSEHIDDENYEYGTEAELEPGLFIAGQDMGVAIDWVGVKVVGKQVPGGTITCWSDMDMSDEWSPMKSSIDGPGKVSIEDEGWFSTIRFNPPNLVGHAPQFRLTATMPAGQKGRNRTEIYEVWAFGNIRPENTDMIIVDVYASKQSRVRGLFQGRKKNTWSSLRDIYRDGRIVELKVPGYGDGERVRAKLIAIESANLSTTGETSTEVPTNSLRLTFRRVDFSGELNVIT